MDLERIAQLCGSRKLIIEMEANGAEWCKEHSDHLLIEWSKLRVDRLVELKRCQDLLQQRIDELTAPGIAQLLQEAVEEIAAGPLSPKKLSRRLDHLLGCKDCKGDYKVAREGLLEEIVNGTGVGSQFWKIGTKLGIEHKPDCSCLLLAEIMNDLGPEGCRENREKILKLMRKNKSKYGWRDFLKAGANAIVLGWAFKLDPLDPLSGLLDMAIEQAEEQ